MISNYSLKFFFSQTVIEGMNEFVFVSFFGRTSPYVWYDMNRDDRPNKYFVTCSPFSVKASLRKDGPQPNLHAFPNLKKEKKNLTVVTFTLHILPFVSLKAWIHWVFFVLFFLTDFSVFHGKVVTTNDCKSTLQDFQARLEAIVCRYNPRKIKHWTVVHSLNNNLNKAKSDIVTR